MSNAPHDGDVVLRRVGRGALIAGIALAVPCLILAISDSGQFYRSYLVAFVVTLAPAAGSMALLALHRLTGGRWGDAIAPILTAAARTFPALALLFVPILFGLEAIYPWAVPGWAELEATSQHKIVFLDARFFIARAAVYFAVWFWLARFVLSERGSSGTGSRGTPRGHSGARGSIALITYVLTMTMAALDWGMSLGPEWYSTMYGLIIILGQVLSALTLAIIVRWVMDRSIPEPDVNIDVYHDLGTLLFAFVMTWTYLGFSQFLIIWSANLPEEVTWYMERLAPGWKVLISVIVAVHFAIPFLLLLMRKVKRKPRHLVKVCALVLAARLPEIIWLIVPAFHPEELRIHWADIALPLAMFALWLALVVDTIRRRAASSDLPEDTLDNMATR